MGSEYFEKKSKLLNSLGYKGSFWKLQDWSLNLPYLSGFRLWVRLNQKHLHGPVLFHRERQCEVAERVKGYRHFGTLRTH